MRRAGFGPCFLQVNTFLKAFESSFGDLLNNCLFLLFDQNFKGFQFLVTMNSLHYWVANMAKFSRPVHT